MDCSTPGLPVHRQLPEFAQTRVHRAGDAIQPSHPLSPPSPPAFHLSQHQGLFQWVSYSHQMSKGLELHLQHQSFQWIFRVDFLSCFLFISFQLLLYFLRILGYTENDLSLISHVFCSSANCRRENLKIPQTHIYMTFVLKCHKWIQIAEKSFLQGLFLPDRAEWHFLPLKFMALL